MKRWLTVLTVFFCVAAAGGTLYKKIISDREGPVIAFDGTLTYREDLTEEELLADVKAVDDRDGDVSGSLVVESFSRPDVSHQAVVTYAARDNNNNITKVKRILPSSEGVWNFGEAGQEGSLDTPVPQAGVLVQEGSGSTSEAEPKDGAKENAGNRSGTASGPEGGTAAGTGSGPEGGTGEGIGSGPESVTGEGIGSGPEDRTGEGTGSGPEGVTGEETGSGSADVNPAEGDAEKESEPETDTEPETEAESEILAPGAPVITLTETRAEIGRGDNFDPLIYVASIVDDYDNIYELWRDIQIEGEYDVEKAGVYRIAFYVIDSAGNTSNHARFKLTVK